MTAVIRVVLASASPRRQALLRELIADFTVDPAAIDEDSLRDPDPWTTARGLAREKALAVQARHGDALVIGGDTVVALHASSLPTVAEASGEWLQLGKPKDEEDARWMLGLLCGRTHSVVTGVCLVWPDGSRAFAETTRVTFRAATPREIDAYVASGEPMDKAGAYGLQSGGARFVERIEGSVSNVIGLPLEKLAEVLRTIDA